MIHRRNSITAALFGLAALALPGESRAANGAYAVDAADISDVGSCKFESWISTATNADFSAVGNPSCVVAIGRPVELTLQANRARSDGDWSTTLTPKAKWNIEPTGVGKFGYSFETGGGIDASSGDNTSVFAVVPATYRLSEVMRVNINAGWFWDRVSDRHYLTYGLGFDWKFTETLQLTVEGYGLAGQATEFSSVTRPRAQAGMRYRPNEIFSVDLIAGHNITGEHANWITLGTTVRFPDAFK